MEMQVKFCHKNNLRQMEQDEVGNQHYITAKRYSCSDLFIIDLKILLQISKFIKWDQHSPSLFFCHYGHWFCYWMT